MASLKRVDEDFAGLVDIGERQLYLECRGSGRPTVILEAGYRCDARTWSSRTDHPDDAQGTVLPAIAAFTRVCAYDRPGTLRTVEHRGRSDPTRMPRSPGDAVTDLHALLRTAGVPSPYVLVGHSYGGVLVRLFTARYPDDVAGLVLIDPSHEEQDARFAAVLPPHELLALRQLDEAVPPELAADADLEQFNFAVGTAQMGQAASQRSLDIPLVVVMQGRPYRDDDPAAWEGISTAGVEAIERESHAMKREFAGLSPEGRLVIAARSGHFVQEDEPDVVITAVRDIVDAVRDRCETIAHT